MTQEFPRNRTPKADKWRLCGRWIILVLALCLTPSVHGADLTFSYTDPVRDFTGTIDVTSMVVVFNNATGNYKIILTTTAAHPFKGMFRVNINLYNPTRLPSNSFFQDAVNDYNLAVAQTILILTGTNSSLTFWSIGDIVAANTWAGLGNPPSSTLFRCGVPNLPLPLVPPLSEDVIGIGLPPWVAPSMTSRATITPLTPQGAVGGLVDDVQVLLETGVLTAGKANALMVKLTAAMSSLNRGNTNSSCGQINAFINQVIAFINSGTLTPAQGAALIQAAQAVRTQIGCS